MTCAESTSKPRTRMKEQLAMTEAISTEPRRYTVHLDRLKRTPDLKEGMERSMLTFTGEDRLGINFGVASYLRDHQASIRSCTERRHDDDTILGSQYVIETPTDALKKIEPNEIEKIGEGCVPVPTSRTQNYQLTIITPDKRGILATIGEMLLKRKVIILSNDTITFIAPLSSELGGTGEDTRVASISMVLGILEESHDKTLEDLKDGLEYLENRYHWYIRLEKQQERKPKKRCEQPPSNLFDFATRTLEIRN